MSSHAAGAPSTQVIWRKRGVIFAPTGELGWMNSHAQVPAVLVLPDRLRVYFATRPQPQTSVPTYIDLDRDDPGTIMGMAGRRILANGRPGTFDVDGVMPSCIVRDGTSVRLYYTGWCRLAGRAPYNNATGLAISDDDGATFRRAFEGPLLDRTADEPWSATSPEVVQTPDGWFMWYSSSTDWIEVGDKLEHVYVIKGATSADGIHWRRDNVAILPPVGPDESQTKPTVLHHAGRWHMWFSYRGSRGFRDTGQTYQIGYAHSTDLRHWERDDARSGIELSTDGWDAQMQCYPAVARVGERIFLFYNGNGFGATGFGYAELTPGRF